MAFLAITAAGPARTQEPDYGVPHFRHAEALGKPPKFDKTRRLVLLADDDFAPFSYRDADGQLRGLAIDTARAACTEMALNCEFRAAAWETLTQALTSGPADAAISGLRTTETVLETLEPTRPFYRALARFAVRKDNPLKHPDLASLAGKRIGAVAASAHAAWLKTYFREVEIVQFGDLAAAEDALRRGDIDALFADALQLVFWTSGPTSQNCCRLADGAFVDQDYFSRGFSFFVKRGDRELKAAFDYALDQLQTKGEFAKIFRLYVPASPW